MVQENPLEFLYSDDDSDGVKVVRIDDRGSKPKRVAVDLQGVPATGVVDSGADITIMGAERFKKVAAVGRLKRCEFKKPDKLPYTYDHRPFSLDGKIELDITFDNCTCT